MSAQPSAAAVPLATQPDERRRDRLAGLFDAHEERLYRLARRLTGSADEARDLVHDTFVKAAGSWGSIPAGATHEEAWLVRVLVNIQRDQWRKRTVRQRTAAALRAQPASYPAAIESALIAKQAIWAALDRLRPRRRAIVVMHEIEGLGPADIAGILGLRTMTVRWHLSMARRELKAALAAYLGGTR